MSNEPNEPRSRKLSRQIKKRLAERLVGPPNVSSTVAGESPSGGSASSAIRVVNEISRTTTKEQILEILVQNQCADLTEDLRSAQLTEAAVACGGLGDVYKGTLSKGKIVAVKCARVHAIECDLDYMQNIAHEIYVWSKCRHKNVLRLRGMGLFRDQVVAVSAWMENGNARDYLKQHPDIDRCQLCVQVATGVAYMHKNGIVHGDIKGANVLISKIGVAKISDFGNACLKEYAIKFDRLPRYTQSERWSAYEICQGDGAYSRETDVYALAMTILEIITGQDPHVQRTSVQVLKAVGVESRIPARPLMLIPTESKHGDILWSMLKRCWSVSPEGRPSASDVRAMLISINDEGLRDESTATFRTSMIFEGLLQYGCPNMTDQLDRARCEKVLTAAEGPFTWYKGVLTDDTQVMLQPIEISSFSAPDPRKNHHQVQNAARDLVLWSRCKHINVAPILGIADLDDQIAVVMPWIDTTDLLAFLLEHHQVDRCKMGASLARGLAHLHSSHLFHYSSHASSIKVSGEGIIKIAPQVGIGTSTHHRCPTCGGRCGALHEFTEMSTSKYKEENDIYGLGAILLEMITGRRRTCSIKNNFQGSQLPERPGCLPAHTKYGDAVWTLLTRCWDPEPRFRPTATAVESSLEGMNDAELYGLSKSGVPLLPVYIHSQMTVPEIMGIFAEHGVSNLTDQLAHGSTTTMENTLKLAGGLNHVVYQGSIARGSLRVAVAMRRRTPFSSDDAVPVSMLRSIYAWSKCSHPNILPLLGLASHNGSLATISPWMDEGNLVGYLERTQDANRCSMATQMADAVAYLHEIGIIHGNLKGSSIQVSDTGVVKLGGFGSASFLHIRSRSQPEPIIFESNSEDIPSPGLGMLRWMAPELLEESLSGPSFASDVYALGMTMLECISGSVPFSEMKNELILMKKLLTKDIEPNRPTSQIPFTSAQGDTLWGLLCRCWEHDPTTRPAAAEVRDIMSTITPEGLMKPWELMVLGAESSFH